MNVVIVGGGTAGWATAAILLLAANKNKAPLSLKVVEPNDIPPIGVGEGSWPSLMTLLWNIGIRPELADSTIKLGVEYQNWYSNQNSKYNRYFHPFLAKWPVKKNGIDIGSNLSWENFHHQYSITDPHDFLEENIEKLKVFGLHFDSYKLGQAFKKRCLLLDNCKTIEGKVKKVNTNKKGIESIKLDSGIVLKADHFVDCTGFKKVLIGKLNPEIIDVSGKILVDTAIVGSIETNDLIKASYTQALAMSSGWAWKIPTSKKVSFGYVFSSKFINESKAKKELLETIKFSSFKTKTITWKPHYLKNFIIKNCSAVGLSSGFLEPLEAVSINATTIQASAVAKLLFKNEQKIEELNEKNLKGFEGAVDYILLHYIAGKRREKFWRYCRKNIRKPKALLEKAHLAATRQADHPAWENSPFNIASWQAVLTGTNSLRD